LIEHQKHSENGNWNACTLNAPGAARLLCRELESAYSAIISIMGLQKVRWSGAGEMQIDKHHLMWSADLLVVNIA